MKPVHDMTVAEALEVANRRELNRRAGRPLDAPPPIHGADPLTTFPPLRPIECSEADDARLEKEHVREGDKQLRALGFRVINTSQPRHAKYITPGVPDRFYFHRARGLGFAWEAKTATGEQSAAQRDFQEDMDACGWPYVLGTDHDLFTWLLARYPLVRDESGHLIWAPIASRGGVYNQTEDVAE